MFTFSRKLILVLRLESVRRCRQTQKQIFRTISSSVGNIQDAQSKKTSPENNIGVPTGVMGQPTCHTHPHLVGANELAAGLTVTEFKNRRSGLMKKLIDNTPKDTKSQGHTVLIPSATKQYVSDKIPFIFRQSSDFYYLTGCLEPDSLLMMTSLPGSEDIHRTILFVRGRDEYSELWDGPRTGVDDAPQMFRVDTALPYSELETFLHHHLSSHTSGNVWYSPSSPVHHECHATILRAIESSRASAQICPRTILSSLRLIKSPAETKLMLEAGKTGSSAINNAMACTKPGISEHDVHAAIDYWCRRAGAEHLAFPPVVGGGTRATSIHYIHDNQMLSYGELLLVDAGCQKACYNSDITRTWPVSGKFSPSQAVLYDIIHSVQSVLMTVLSEHRPTLDKLFNIMCTTLGSHLKEAGLIPKSSSDADIFALAYKFCPHHVSHYLGIDVHDTPPVPRSIPVQPGMVITVEPGIYINANDKSVPPEFRGIGIRIEDDVLITHGKPTVLTETCIKHRKDIENIVGTRNLPE